MRLSRLAFFDGSPLPACEAGDRVPPSSFTVLKYGSVSFTKGGERGSFEFTEADAANVIAEFSARGRDLVVDYEHQTLSGSKAPAAGWIAALEKGAEGLVAKVKYWTEEAKALLSSGEYRYFSPVLHFSRSGRSVSAIHSVALTNHPALHQAPALVADDAAEAGSGEGLPDQANEQERKEDVQMDELLKRLGLPSLADAGAAEKADAVARELDALLKLKGELEGFLKLHGIASLEELAAKLAGAAPAADLSKLEEALKRRDAETAVSKAFADGKLAERARSWALDFAKRDIEAFKDWAEAAPRVVPGNDVELAPLGSPAANDAVELEVYMALGLSDGQIEKLRKG